MNSAATTTSRLGGNRRIPLRGLPGGRRAVLAALICISLIVATWLTFRFSNLAAVKEVRVVGLGGYYDRAARIAVASEARQMNTLAINDEALAVAAGRYVEIESVSTEVNFPHGLTVQIGVRRPVAVTRIGARIVGLTGSGEVLQGARGITGLPKIEVGGPIAKGRVTNAKARASLAVLGSAPDLMLRRVKAVRFGRRGLTVDLEKGVALYFGSSSNAGSKWRAAATVLAGSAAIGAAYIDLRVPDRPAVGGLGAAPVTPKPASLAEPITAEPATGAVGATGGTP